MDILREAHSILSHAGYQVSQLQGGTNRFFFEDSVLYGFVCLQDKPEDVISFWEATQDAFLSQHAESIRHAPEKAWNAYSVYLTGAQATDAIRCSFLRIEEDFRGTRKIARAGVVTPDDLTNALLPLLPLKNVAAVQPLDFKQRLRERMNLSEAEFTALTQEDRPESFVQTLLEGG